MACKLFPISRDPPEGGTANEYVYSIDSSFVSNFSGSPRRGNCPFWNLRSKSARLFPISRDPPEGGTRHTKFLVKAAVSAGFQFLGIPPKGELQGSEGIYRGVSRQFPISRDPPEGGTASRMRVKSLPGLNPVSNF